MRKTQIYFLVFLYIFHILDNYARAERYVFSLVPRRCVSIKNKEQLQFEEKKMSLALIGRYANYAVSSESSRKNNISLLFATQNLILRKGTKLTKRPWSRLLRPRPRGPSTGS